jgi:hypothetical protein
MIARPKDPRPIGEEDDSYLKPGMKDENEKAHKIGIHTPVKKIPIKKAMSVPKVPAAQAKAAALKAAYEKFGKGMKK